MNNIDDILTTPPEPDIWAERDELTEDTGKASVLKWGTAPDPYFDAARAVGAALRKLRPKGRRQPEPEQPKRASGQQISMCDKCNRYGVVGEFHACYPGSMTTPLTNPREYVEFDYEETLRKIMDREPHDYYDFVKVVDLLTRGRKERSDVPAEWRTVPGYGNYALHSLTRELWRRAHDVVLPNGKVRRYPARRVTPVEGAVSLTAEGKSTSRGINALWAETFPEYGKKKRKKRKGTEVQPHRDETSCYAGLREWLAEGGARIVTRPQ